MCDERFCGAVCMWVDVPAALSGMGVSRRNRARARGLAWASNTFSLRTNSYGQTGGHREGQGLEGVWGVGSGL